MASDEDYRIRLAPRNEGVEYTDSQGAYRFAVTHTAKEWAILLPATRGDNFEPHELSPDEEARILPRVSRYLSRVKWFGVFPRSYSVRFVHRQYAGHDMVGTFYSSMGDSRAVITREGTADYRVWLERRDDSAPADRGMPSWTPGEQRRTDTMDRAKVLAKELLSDS